MPTLKDTVSYLQQLEKSFLSLAPLEKAPVLSEKTLKLMSEEQKKAFEDIRNHAVKLSVAPYQQAMSELTQLKKEADAFKKDIAGNKELQKSPDARVEFNQFFKKLDEHGKRVEYSVSVFSQMNKVEQDQLQVIRKHIAQLGSVSDARLPGEFAQLSKETNALRSSLEADKNMSPATKSELNSFLGRINPTIFSYLPKEVPAQLQAADPKLALKNIAEAQNVLSAAGVFQNTVPMKYIANLKIHLEQQKNPHDPQFIKQLTEVHGMVERMVSTAPAGKFGQVKKAESLLNDAMKAVGIGQGLNKGAAIESAAHEVFAQLPGVKAIQEQHDFAMVQPKGLPHQQAIPVLPGIASGDIKREV